MSTRRDFIKQAAAVTVTALAGHSFLSPASAEAKKKALGANDKIHIGVIGVNSRGKALASNFAKMPGCEVGFLCDCDSDALARCQESVRKVTGKTPKGEKDIRRFLENKDIDAVVIATPDHWHAPAAIMALRAGKHVYLEKPTSHNPAENQMLLRAEKKYATQVITVGNQRRSWPQVREAIEELHSGVIGKVHFAKTWYTNNRPSIGIGKVVPVPAHLDWDLWQGPAPRVAEFRDNYIHYNWHWFWRWGTGEALNNGTHFVDLLRWGLEVGYPTQVSSVGGRWRFQDDWEAYDSQLISFQFGDQAAGSWEGRSCNMVPVDGKSSGVTFYGESGAMSLSGGNEYKIFDIKGKLVKHVKSTVAFRDGDLQNPSEQLDGFHFQNWFNAIRFGEKLNSTLEEACKSTQLVQLGNIAARTGHSLQVNPQTGFIIGDPEAQQYWGRDYEPGWEPFI